MGGEKGMKAETETAKEMPPGVERLTIDSLEQFEHVIKSLRFNALDTDESENFGDRKEEVGHLYETYLKSGEDGELFVVREGEDIVGFLAVRKHVASHEASIEQMRVFQKHGQEDVIERLLLAAKVNLGNEGYHHATINDGSLSDDVRKVSNRFVLNNFLSITKKAPETASEKLAA